MDQQTQVTRVIRSYSESFKRQVVEEYLAGGITQSALQRKYDIRGKCAILYWRRKFSCEAPVTLSNLSALIPVEVTKKEVKSFSELNQRIKELERQLEDEKLRTEAYQRIIEKAEKELKIPIRKKPNTK